MNNPDTYEELPQQRTIKHRGLNYNERCKRAVNPVELNELNLIKGVVAQQDIYNSSYPNKEGRAT